MGGPEEPMATRVGELSGRTGGMASTQADRPTTMLEGHADQLSNLESQLERAVLQYQNMLDRLRGPQPSAGMDADKPLQPESMAQRLANSTDRLHMLTNTLNEQADELNSLI